MRRRLPKELTGGQSQFIGLMTDEVEAIETAKAALLADLRFEHLRSTNDDVWHFASQCWLDRRANHVPAFLKRHRREPMDAVCYIPVEFLTVEAETDVFGSRLLPVTDPRVPPERPWFPRGKPVGCIAAVDVRGTSYGQMAERARAAASHALRVLRVALRGAGYGDRQLRFRLGIGYAVDRAFTGWDQRQDVAYDLKLGGNVLAKVLGQPVPALPANPSTDVAKKADLALRWMERASFTGEPVVAMLYLFFALEALLGDTSEGLKSHGLAFRVTMLSHIITGGFRHPHATLVLYEQVRNGAVHGGEVPEVSWRDVQGLEWAVRDVLSQYLTLAEQHGLARRGRLLKVLDEHPDRPQLIAWLRLYGGPDWTRYLDRIEWPQGGC